MIIHFVEFTFFVRALFDVLPVTIDNDFDFFIQFDAPVERSLLFFSCGFGNRKAIVY